jgi:hypothetical protein
MGGLRFWTCLESGRQKLLSDVEILYNELTIKILSWSNNLIKIKTPHNEKTSSKNKRN